MDTCARAVATAMALLVLRLATVQALPASAGVAPTMKFGTTHLMVILTDAEVGTDDTIAGPVRGRRVQAVQSCTSAQDFQVRQAVAMDACCPSGSDDNRSCSLQADCPSAACAAVFLSFTIDCKGILPTMPSVPADQFHSFSNSCRELAGPEAASDPDDQDTSAPGESSSGIGTLILYSIPGFVLVVGYCLRAEIQRKRADPAQGTAISSIARPRVLMTSSYDAEAASA